MVDVTGSVYPVKKQRDGFSKIREGGDDGFVKQMKQNTCKHMEKADGTTSATEEIVEIRYRLRSRQERMANLTTKKV